MEPMQLKLFYHPADRLRLTIGDEKSYITVKPVWASPLLRPDTYLALLDGKGNEITIVKDPKTLLPESWEAVKRELYHRYLTATVQAVVSAKQEFGATYWNVETDRGTRDFVTQSLQENALWFSDTHLMLLDTDGNRFEIPDVSALDERSREIIHSIL